MTELGELQRLDERTRQIAGLYAAEKRRADRLEKALRQIVKELKYETGGSLNDLVAAINNAVKLVEG